jgi:general secretion pathway protein B
VSIILDALRKSEHSRDGRALPGVVDLPRPRAAHARLPLVLALIGALLVVNVAVLVVVLLRRPAVAPPPPAPAAAAPAARATPVPAAVPAPRPGPAREVRPLGAEAATDADALDADADAEPDAAEPRAPPSHVVSRAARLPAPAAETAAEPAPTTRVPSVDDLPPQMASGLPRLNLDLHVWNKDPAQRWVVINGQRVREGQDLREGPHLVEVTSDGVVLDYQGTRFLLRHQ